MTALNTLFAAHQNAMCSVEQKNGDAKMFRIAQLSDKIGTMKNGEKAPYVILVSDDQTGVVINLHPEHAKRLMKKGEDSGIKVVTEVVTEVAPVIEAVVEVATEAAPLKSKKAQAIDIYVANAGAKRKHIIDLFKDQLGMSDAGGATYYYNIHSGQWK